METISTKYQTYINSNKVMSWINKFVNSYSFIFIIGLLVLLSSSFAIEVYIFPIISLLGVITLLVSKDTKPIIPIVLTFLMGMSYKNGLSYNPNKELPNIYDNKGIAIYLFSLIVIVLIAGIINQFLFKQYKNSWKNTLLLLPGIISLSIGYLLSSIGTKDYPQNLAYTSSNVAMIIAIYIFFSQTAFSNKDKKPIKYISIVMLMSALLIGLEVTHIYLTNNVVVDGMIEKGRIVNGWGISNNFSGYIILCFPFISYLLLTEKHAFKYLIAIIFSIFFNVMCLSRNGLVINMIEIVITLVLLVIYRRKDSWLVISSFASALITILFLCIFHKSVYLLFKQILEQGASLGGRTELYSTAWDSFISNPIFGKGWFIITGEVAPSPTFFAPNYKVHNIILQLLGSTGIVGIIGFIIFCMNINERTFKNFNKEKLIPFIGILVLILSSIMDNYFFDYGFERYLGILLVCIVAFDNLSYRKLYTTNNKN